MSSSPTTSPGSLPPFVPVPYPIVVTRTTGGSQALYFDEADAFFAKRSAGR